MASKGQASVGGQMGRRSQTEVLEHYVRFVLREEAGSLRERLVDTLVAGALKTSSPDHWMDAKNLQIRISSFTSLPDYPADVIDEALQRLLSRLEAEQSLTPNGLSQYRLSRRSFDLLAAAEKADPEEAAAIEVVVREVEKGAGGRLSKPEAGLVSEAFRQLVAQMLSSLGEQCARCLVDEGHLGDSNHAQLSPLLASALAPLPPELGTPTETVFLRTLREPSEVVRKYLFAAGRAYYLVNLLHLDPHLQVLERRQFEDTTLYLDTNILVAAFLPEDHNHEAVRSLLSLSATLGFKLAYTDRTRVELEELIGAADREYSDAPPHDPSTAAVFADIMDNPFAKAFFRSYAEHRLSWSQYRLRLAGSHQVLADLGIELRPDEDDGGPGTRYEGLRSQLVQESRRGRASRPKAAEHDAHLVCMIERQVREDGSESHPFGRRFWLITLHRRLVNLIRASLPDVGCVGMMPDEWLQYIAPFLAPQVAGKEAADVFSRLLASRLFMTAADSVSLRELQPFTAPGVKSLISDLAPDEACRMVSEIRQNVASMRVEERDEAAIAQLAELAEQKALEKLERGELVPADDLRRSEAKLIGQISTKDEALTRIGQEKDALAGNLTYLKAKTNSIWGLLDLLVVRLFGWTRRPLHWLRRRWLRVGLSVALGVLIALWLFYGWGGATVTGVVCAGLLIPLFAIATPLFGKLREWFTRSEA